MTSFAIRPDRRPARIVVLVSGAGTNMAALLEATGDPSYGARVVAVGADRSDTGGVEAARRAGLPTFVRQLSGSPTREAWNEALRDDVAAHSPDIVVLAGFLKLVSPAFHDASPWRVANTHNALLPSFPGVHGPADALAYGVKVTGATVFIVDSGMDTGPILGQVTCPVLDADTEEALSERIKDVERIQLVEIVGAMAREGWWIDGRRAGIGERYART